MRLSAKFTNRESANHALTRMRQEGVTFSIIEIGDTVEMNVRSEQIDSARGILRAIGAADVRVVG